MHDLCTKVEEAGSLPFVGHLEVIDDYFRHNMYVYISCLRCKAIILSIVCMGLPHNYHYCWQMVKSLKSNYVLDDDNKCISLPLKLHKPHASVTPVAFLHASI